MMKKKFNIAARQRRKLTAESSRIAKEAGAIIMQHYHAAADDDSALNIELKDDESPVTAADHAAHHFIIAELQKITPGIAIVSEENHEHPDLKDGEPFWTVDPLDGTKEFIHRTGGFAVKIALIDKGVPVLGSIYCPAHDVLYFTRWGSPAYRQDGSNPPRILSSVSQSKDGSLRVLFNEKHANKTAYDKIAGMVKKEGLILPKKPDGRPGLPRNLQVAEGIADLYVDCGYNENLKDGCGFSWDYAPDWLMLKNAGGIMIEVLSGREMTFDRPWEPGHAYIGFGDKRLGKRVFPNMKKIAFKP